MFEDDLRSYFPFLAAILNKLNIELYIETRIWNALFLCTLDIYKSKSKFKKAWSQSARLHFNLPNSLPANNRRETDELIHVTPFSRTRRRQLTHAGHILTVVSKHSLSVFLSDLRDRY